MTTVLSHSNRREALVSVAGGILSVSAAKASDKLKIAFIGIAGGYGHRALEELARQDIVAICDVDWRTKEQQNSRFITPLEVAAKHPGVRKFDDWRRMLEEMDKGLDGVVVCTPDHTH